MKSRKQQRPRHKGSGTVFKNPALEKLTRTHIAVPLVLYPLVSAGFIYYGVAELGFTASQMALLFFIGMVVYTLVEYLMHRYLYHIAPYTKALEKFSYKVHGVHHEYPKDKKRLAMPPILALVLVAFFFLLFGILMGDYVFGFLPGFVMGYTFYLGIHYSVHAFKVPDNFLRVLWHHHAIHHYRQPDRAFGISSPLWDYIFGTMPKLRKDNAGKGEYIDPA
ncbi:sterol desaturase family protein [Pricia sp. S334]|uniref:Sterol desaturase family protein n=1 Tax=Pricia mediterranea TaxID=3076079 RepID=A0ABU3L7Z9_9FLAO|nr:sterol desaturase family protein [Pricia sp. S334]MDT7829314.1 sterol desaturase family protein [Pricia sp. S334]